MVPLSLYYYTTVAPADFRKIDLLVQLLLPLYPQQPLLSSEKYLYLSPFYYHYTIAAPAELRKKA
jgi:hypothetical protein